LTAFVQEIAMTERILQALTLATTLIGAAFVAACSPAPPATQSSATTTAWPGTIIDLSHTYDQTTIFWPTAEPFKLEKISDGITPGGYYYAANNFRMAEHGGTHLDAPVHFAQGKHAADAVPLDQLIGFAAVVDVTAKCESNSDYLVTQADLEAWERTNGAMPAGAIVLIRTGFSKRWPDAARYLGTAERGPQAAPKLHFPGVHPDAARWIVANRSIKAIGIDTASIDYGQSTDYQTHRVLYERNIPGLENLTNLDRLPATGAQILALPMKIGGGSGAPLRAVAIVKP
jgi:kynurenine formamidase